MSLNRSTENIYLLKHKDIVVRNASLNNTVKNNMYWRPDAATDSAELDITITESGEVDNVFNGIPDWVYEEEVLGVNYAHYLNDIGDTVAYAQFNDTLVRDFQYPFYGDQHVRKQT